MTPEQARAELARRELAKRQQLRGAGATGTFDDKPLPSAFRGASAGMTTSYDPNEPVITGGQAVGALARGEMTAAGAILKAPSVAVKQWGLLNQWSWAERVLSEKDPEKQKSFQKQMFQAKQTTDKVADWLGESAQLHKQGVETILKNHPEWASEPPKSFVDLVTNPVKLGVAMTEAIPLLANATILTVAGQPNMAVGLMYVTEGQSAYDQAKQDKASEEDAVAAYGLYGSVSAALETMQVQGLIKIAKGSYNALLNRTAQKLVKTGGRSLTYDIIKTAVTQSVQEMSQGTAGELVAKAVYDKDIQGGLAGFVDRRAQEATVAAALSIIPGVAGGVAAKVRSTGAQPVSEAGVPQVVGPTEQPTQQINVYKTVSGSRTGITEQEVTREGERYVDSVTGEDVILDQAASGSAITRPTKVIEPGAETKLTYDLSTLQGRKEASIQTIQRAKEIARLLGFDVPEGTLFVSMYPTEEGIRAVSHGTVGMSIYVSPGVSQEQIDAAIIHEIGHVLYPKAEPGLTMGRYEDEKKIDLWTNEQIRKLKLLAQPAPAAIETEPLKTPTPEEMQTKADEIHQTIDGGKIRVRLRAEPRSEKELLWRGHALPEALGLDEDSRRDLMQEIIKRRSMKDATQEEREFFVAYLEGLAEQSGVEIDKPVIERAIERLTAISKKQKKLTPTEETHPELHRTWLEKISQDIKSWSSEAYHELMRIERFIESLDGEENGVLYDNIWKPTKAADELAIDKTFMSFEEFLQVMEENGFDPALTMGKVEKISPGVELTRMQQIGVYNKSKNENGLRYLREGMGISDADIAKISDGLTDTQKKLADWYLEKWRAYWPLIVKVADSIGMDVDKLEQEFNYSTLIRTDIDPSEEVELTDTLTDQFTQESFKPEQGFLEKRKKRAVGKIELDEAVSYLTSMRRIERFLAMAPVAKKVGAILKNRKFKSALNDATYGHGVKLLNTWMQDSIRGYVSEDAGRWNKTLSILRRNAAVYAIGWNIPSVFRQALALSNAAAVSPLMLKYIPINTAKATRNFGKLEKEVLEKSALVRTRDIDRDVRRKWDRETIGKRLGGKDPFDKKSLAWLKWMDHRTIVVGWKSLYDTAIEKGKTEKEAIEYADKWISRTQEMGGAKDLPHFFRGGTMAKIITTFENQVNNQFNFYAHDIIGARRRGDISNTEVAYKVMFSHILPAILMGMIGRGGLPKTWKQLLTDVVTYPIASLMLIGRLINRTITGFSNSTSIVEAGPEAVGQAARAAVKGNVRKFITEAAKAIGAITGKVPAQVIRTIGGAYDLATGVTKDPRRLIWSEWALEQGKKKSVTPPRRPPTRPPARRPPTRRPG